MKWRGGERVDIMRGRRKLYRFERNPPDLLKQRHDVHVWRNITPLRARHPAARQARETDMTALTLAEQCDAIRVVPDARRFQNFRPGALVDEFGYYHFPDLTVRWEKAWDAFDAAYAAGVRSIEVQNLPALVNHAPRRW